MLQFRKMLTSLRVNRHIFSETMFRQSMIRLVGRPHFHSVPGFTLSLVLVVYRVWALYVILCSLGVSLFRSHKMCR